VVKIDKPNVRVRYDLQEIGSPNLAEVLEAFLKEHRLV
jgi:predicted GTPase